MPHRFGGAYKLSILDQPSKALRIRVQGRAVTVEMVSALRRMRKTAEDSLLQSNPLLEASKQSSRRDRIRDALARLRDRDSRIGAARTLWAELRTVDDQGALIMMEELLGLHQSTMACGIASAILTDDTASVSARRHVLALLMAVAATHPASCAARLRAALRFVAVVAQQCAGLSQECARVAGCLACDLFPHAAARQGGSATRDGRAVIEALISPFLLMLSRPQARGRRAVAACIAAIISAMPSPGVVWLTRSPHARAFSATRTTEVADALRRRMASHGTLNGAIVTPLPNDSGVVVQCREHESVQELLSELSSCEALPLDWQLDVGVAILWGLQNRSQAAQEHAAHQQAQMHAFIFAVAPCVASIGLVLSRQSSQVAPGAAALAAWIEEACRRHCDALEPFFNAASALLTLQHAAAKLSNDAKSQNAKRDVQVTAQAAADMIAAAISEAAPHFARYAVRCIDGSMSGGVVNEATLWRDRVAALHLVEGLATSECCHESASLLAAPLITAADRARYDPVRTVREAARRALLALESVEVPANDRAARRCEQNSHSLMVMLGARLQKSRAFLSTISEAPAPAHAASIRSPSSPASGLWCCVREATPPTTPPTPKSSEKHTSKVRRHRFLFDRPRTRLKGDTQRKASDDVALRSVQTYTEGCVHTKAPEKGDDAISGDDDQESTSLLATRADGIYPHIFELVDEVRTLRRRVNNIASRCGEVNPAFSRVDAEKYMRQYKKADACSENFIKDGNELKWDDDAPFVRTHRTAETSKGLVDSWTTRAHDILLRSQEVMSPHSDSCKADNKAARSRILERLARAFVMDAGLNVDHLLWLLLFDPSETRHALASSEGIYCGVVQRASMLACEPSDRGVNASALLFALTHGKPENPRASAPIMSCASKCDYV